MQFRLEFGRRLLVHFVAGTADVDEATGDRIISDAEEAGRKLDGDGEKVRRYVRIEVDDPL